MLLSQMPLVREDVAMAVRRGRGGDDASTGVALAIVCAPRGRIYNPFICFMACTVWT